LLLGGFALRPVLPWRMLLHLASKYVLQLIQHIEMLVSWDFSNPQLLPLQVHWWLVQLLPKRVHRHHWQLLMKPLQ
jgi:hypothetical protein